MRLLLFLVIVALLPGAGWANRVALVIGNADYRHVPALDNPGNDARDVSAALEQQGYAVTQVRDATREQLYGALRRFRSVADGAEIAMVYYAGHGIEIGGTNYIIPVDARLADERDADTELISMNVVLRQLSGASRLKMLVLDACRDNPFANQMERRIASRNVGRGLALVRSADAATLIAYAAAAGEVTPDGISGQNSPFTTAFLRALAKPPADVRIILGAARDELARIIDGANPFVYTSLGEDRVIINPRSPAPAREPAPRKPRETPVSERMLRDFLTTDVLNSVAAWDTFLDTYAGQSSELLYVSALQRRNRLIQQAAIPAEETPPRRTEPPDGQAGPPVARPEPAPVPTPEPEAAPGPAPDPEPVPEPQITKSVDQLTRDLQAVLKERNCYRGPIDGIWGRGSRAAMSAFRKTSGLYLSVDISTTAAEIDAFLAEAAQVADARCKPAAPAPVARLPEPAPAQPSPGAAKPVQNTPPAVAEPQQATVLTKEEQRVWSSYCYPDGRVKKDWSAYYRRDCAKIARKLGR